MSLTITNQRPTDLDPSALISPKGAIDPVEHLRTSIIEPLLTPLNTTPVSVVDATGASYDVDDITQILVNCLGDDVDVPAETFMRDLMSQSLFHFDTSDSLNIDTLLANQAATRLKMPAPVPMKCVYVPDDVISEARRTLAGKDDGMGLTAALTYAYKPDTLGFWFQTEGAYDDFKAWAQVQVTSLQSVVPANTQAAMTQFLSSSKLDSLTDSMSLRGSDVDNNEEYSFARLVVYLLTRYAQDQRQAVAAGTQTDQLAGLMPFSLAQLYLPRSVVIVNVEKHARARPRRISAEWKLIRDALATIPRIVPNNRMSKLTAMQRAAKKSMSQAANSQSNKRAQIARAAQMKMRKRPPSSGSLLKDISRVLTRMGNVNRSQNIFRQTKTTFAKANRRDPDDFNRPGKITSVKYMPDLHIYIDASGSISAENYQDTVMLLIQIARKLEVNLYVNFFTQALSQEYLLKTANKSVAEIWRQFKRLPKITGGTSYDQIWSYINMSPQRKRRLSLIVTDFEWNPPRSSHEHPKNLYYAPCSNMDWKRMMFWVKHYIKGMQHIEPVTAQRMLGIFH